jgi:hypothetical protein
MRNYCFGMTYALAIRLAEASPLLSVYNASR